MRRKEKVNDGINLKKTFAWLSWVKCHSCKQEIIRESVWETDCQEYNFSEPWKGTPQICFCIKCCPSKYDAEKLLAKNGLVVRK